MPGLGALALPAAAAGAVAAAGGAGAVGGVTVASGSRGARVPLPGELPLRTRGRHVVDAAGQPLRLACVNWYGAHLKQMVLTGLDVRPLADIAATVVQLGFNCVRLPFSLDVVLGNRTQVPRPSKWLAANPSLQDHSPLEVFDAAVAELTRAGLLVILNNHISSSGWCCGFRDAEGLWYTEKYPEALWLDGLGLMAARYRGNPRVVGFDLRNELRPSSSHVPTWGSGDPATDWALAAEKGGQRVAAENENMLIVVSGMLYCMFLCDVPARPVHLSPALRSRTVYTAHEYGMTSISLQVRGVLAQAVPVIAACHVCLWLLVLAAGLPVPHALRARGASSEQARDAECRPSRPWCSGRVRLCLEACALLLPLLVLVGVAAPFVKYVPTCGFTGNLPLLLTILSGALLTLLSLGLWLSVLGHRLCGRCGPCACAPHGGEVAPEERTGGPAEEAPPLSSCADEGPRAVRGRCRRAARCSRARLASVVTAAAAAVLLGAWAAFGSYRAFEDELDRRWGFLVQAQEGGEEATAPVWVGEFGENRQSLWWDYFVRYLGERQEVGWAYWSLNGDPRHPYMAVLLEDSRTVRHGWKLQALQGLMASPPS